jgi:predicted phosphodiesterase
MKLGIFSDLHLEFSSWDYEPDPDVFYINAGDTHPYPEIREYFRKKFQDNYFGVMGNHDYYHGTFEGAEGHFSSRIEGGIKIAGATLWTEMTPTEWELYTEMLVDYRYTRNLNYDNYVHTHKIHKKFLMESGADVIVTHHSPSFLSVAERFKGNAMNCGFATELYNDITSMSKPPKLWIHGHMHNRSDYMIGDTRVIAWPRGYPNENEWFINYKPLMLEI